MTKKMKEAKFKMNPESVWAETRLAHFMEGVIGEKRGGMNLGNWSALNLVSTSSSALASSRSPRPRSEMR